MVTVKNILEAALSFARQTFNATAFRVTVAPFILRALTVCERAGFRKVGEFDSPQRRSFQVLVKERGKTI